MAGRFPNQSLAKPRRPFTLAAKRAGPNDRLNDGSRRIEAKKIRGKIILHNRAGMRYLHTATSRSSLRAGISTVTTIYHWLILAIVVETYVP